MNIALRLFRLPLLALAATSLPAPAAAASPSLVSGAFGMAGLDQQRPRDQAREQDRAFRAAREGRSMPLPMIERQVRPQMGGAIHIGSELKGESTRLKYMQDGRVIVVDVDPATGRILRRSSGN